MEMKVRALDGQEKSLQEKEQEILAQHEASQAAAEAAAQAAQLEQESQAVAAAASEQDLFELDDEKVLSYLGKKYNKDLTSFDDLVAERKDSEQLPEDVSAFLKYKKETGRGIEDFLKLNKDYETADPDQLLREYYLATEDGIDADDVDVIMAEFSYDEDYDDDSSVKKAKLAKKKAIVEAKKFFNEQKEMYKIPLESRGVGIPDAEMEEFNAYKQYINQAKTYEEEANRKRDWFFRKTDEVFGGEFKGFEFNLGEKSLYYKPNEAAELKKIQMNPENFINKFVDESGLISDAVGYHKSLAIAMNPEKFAQFFYEQGKADAVGSLDKRIKNIDMSANNATAISGNSDAPKIRALNPDSGNGLKIKVKR
jgi:hypothetical protein